MNKYHRRRIVAVLVLAGFIASLTSVIKYGILPMFETKKVTVSATAIENPFKSPALAKYLAMQSNDITAGFFDVKSGKTYLYQPGSPQISASMVKINILAALLYSAKRVNRLLTTEESSLARRMIQVSDNDAASALWPRIGYAAGLNAFNAKLGLTQTKAVPSWGLETTTPRDQLTLLKNIVLAESALSPASQKFIQNLMENVISEHQFGIPSGVPSSATVGVKNGWFPESTTGWQVNTAGYVRTADHFYLAVIMTSRNRSQISGTNVVNKISQLLWAFESSR